MIASTLQSEADQLQAHFRDHAPEYKFGAGPPPVDVSLLRAGPNACSRTYMFAVGSAANRVFVKVPVAPAQPGGARPRVVPLPDFSKKHELEYHALTAAQEHFQALGDPRFGAVRVLGHLVNPGAVIMEPVAHPTLAKLFRAVALRRMPPSSLLPVFENAGGWLQEWHSVPPTRYAVPRGERREHLVVAVNSFVSFLTKVVGEVAALERIRAAIGPLSRQSLPEKLPLVLGHCDYGLPNIFVGPGNRVAGYDMTAAWRAPPYEDIGYFLTSMKTNRVMLATAGLARRTVPIRQYEEAFLNGYFGEHRRPNGAIALFELVALLDRWSALVARAGHSSYVRLATFSLSRAADHLLDAAAADDHTIEGYS
ncbi:MAG: hypothetical protein H0X16_01350 [Chloroflexi bacterium]|nr:hypothetical protein [Chloroflexota bacterium]